MCLLVPGWSWSMIGLVPTCVSPVDFRILTRNFPSLLTIPNTHKHWLMFSRSLIRWLFPSLKWLAFNDGNNAHGSSVSFSNFTVKGYSCFLCGLIVVGTRTSCWTFLSWFTCLITKLVSSVSNALYYLSQFGLLRYYHWNWFALVSASIIRIAPCAIHFPLPSN